MRRLEIDDTDRELVTLASDLLAKNFDPVQHAVASAIRCTDGTIYKGLHIGGRRIDVCAEQITIGIALSAGHREFAACASVIMSPAGVPEVTSPCGVCREVLSWYGPDMTVLILDGEEVGKTYAADLLPAAWIPPTPHRAGSRSGNPYKDPSFFILDS